MTLAQLPTYQEIDAGGIVLLAFILTLMVWRIWSGALGFPQLRAISRTGATGGSDPRRRGLLSSLISVLLLDVGTSRPLETCSRVKRSSHVLIFWGFVFDGIATTLAYFMKPEGAVLPLDHPVKLFGNAGGILLVVGCAAMFSVRFQESGSIWDLHRSDYFLIALMLTPLSGFLVESSIYITGRDAMATPFFYWGHMAIIVALLATAPYTKFTHAFYKPSWILYERVTGEPPQSFAAGSSSSGVRASGTEGESVPRGDTQKRGAG